MQASVAADSIHSSEHNLDPSYRAELDNVDKSRTHLNEVLVSEDLHDVYAREFGPAVASYNARQKRKDRRIESYYDKISESDQEKLYYELIVQIGDRDNNSALDASSRERSGEVYRDYLERFNERYGHVLRVFEAVIHNDEATPHMHLAFVPVVENKGKNGLAVKNSFRQAMQELGIENGRAVEFYHGSHELLADVMGDHGIEKSASRYDRANRGDMTQDEYAEFSRNQERLIESREKLGAAKDELAKVIHEGNAARRERNELQKGNSVLESKQRRIAGVVKDLQGERFELRREIGEARAELETARADLAEANKVVESAIELHETISRAIDSASVELSDVTDKMLERAAKLEQMDESATAKEARLRDLDAAISERSRELDAAAKRLDEANAKLAEARDGAEKLRDEVSELRKEKSALEKFIASVEEKVERIIERLRPYLPNPILALAKMFRDNNEWGKERWHDVMDDTAIDLIAELPNALDEEIERAAAASRQSLEYGFDGRSKSTKRDEWEI